jgi:hypothetical protein
MIGAMDPLWAEAAVRGFKINAAMANTIADRSTAATHLFGIESTPVIAPA